MSRRKSSKTKAPPLVGLKPKMPILATFLSIAVVVVAASAANVILHGRVSTSGKEQVQPVSGVSSSISDKQASGRSRPTNVATPHANMVDKYGPAAGSPAVAAAIAHIEATAPSKAAIAASDRFENLLNGSPSASTDPSVLIMAGYVPPGMNPATVSMLSRSLPKLPTMPRTGPFTEQEINRMAGMPADPQDAMLTSVGMNRTQIDAANHAALEQYTRAEHGPITLPPLHADHDWLAKHATKVGNGFVVTKDYCGSISEMTDSNGNIVAQYSYDPWGVQTQVAGTGRADFGFAGMYVHHRSGLNLTMFRPYSPTLGRWLSRDPLGETAGTNLYAYALNNPVNFRDPLGLDVWVESGAGFPEPLYHQSINVGDPNGNYYSQSFGASGVNSSGIVGQVYTDPMHGGNIEQYAKSTTAQDASIKQGLMKELGQQGPYNVQSQCRSYSQNKFNQILQTYGLTPSAPPSRPFDMYQYTGILPVTATLGMSSAASTTIVVPK